LLRKGTMLSSLKGLDLSQLSVHQLEGIADTVDAFVFKQHQSGEKFHPDYKKNRKLFKKLIRETVKFKRDMRRFFLDQLSRIEYAVLYASYRADEIEDRYLSSVQWDEEDKTLTATLEINLSDIFVIGARATELELQTDLNIGPTHTEEAKFLRTYSLKLAGEINATTKKRIVQQIRTSIEVGETRQELALRIDKVLNNVKRAEMIAQTESIRAYAEGRLAVGKRLKIPYKQLRSFQVDSGEICGKVNGEVVPLDAPFANGLHSPPFHPRCRCSLKLLYTNPNVENDQAEVPDLSADTSIFDSAR
jgi:SPP1 gp7 family putative phage head morphogenesis protein